MSSTKNKNGGWCCDRVLGSGAFGIVELWIHPASGKKLAIKKCKWDVSQLTETQKLRWFQEVERMSQLNHPNIVKTIDLPFKLPDKDKTLPILCMEYCRKGDLRRLLNKAENCCGVNEQDVITIMKHISSAVKYLHDCCITHRDLKPENIVLQDERNSTSYKLIDLGYAKDLGEASTCASIVGTLNYVAPELLWKKKYSCSVDYWGLGILFYELITGTRPFLPNMPQPIAWMQHIKNKKYDDIRAYKLNEEIIFGQDIEEPTQISRHLKDKLVEWFRIVLQWDPRERGKRSNENGVSQLVVFKLLDKILSKKIVYVFYASLYTLRAYEVSESTTVADIQKLIEADIHVQVREQVVTSYFGKLLIPDKPLLPQINEPTLFLFKNGHPMLYDVPEVNIPEPVQEMMGGICQLNFDTLTNYYRLAVFLLKKEVELFESYIFALSIKIDLLILKLNTLNESVKSSITDIKEFARKFYGVHYRQGSEVVNKENMKVLETIFEEIKTVLRNADEVRNEILASQDVSPKEMMEIYTNACTIYVTFKNTRIDKYEQPKEMLKLVFTFLQIRDTQFRSGSIFKVTQKIWQLEERITLLEGTFESVIMAVLFQDVQSISQHTVNCGSSIRKETQNVRAVVVNNQEEDLIAQQPEAMQISDECNSSHFLNSSVSQFTKVTESDDIIYDNLIIRNALSNLLVDIRNTMQNTWMD